MKRIASALIGTSLLCLGIANRPGPASLAPVPHGPSPLIAGSIFSHDPIDAPNDVIEQYCQSCHNDERLRGNLSLDGFDAEAAETNVEIAELMIRKLRAGMMPPAGVRRPGGDTLQALAEALETRIDAVALAEPDPGSRTFQRLNRAEYSRSIEQLLDLQVDVSAYLPGETMSDNFDNIADVQMLSATLMDGYLRAASEIARLAVGDPEAGPRQTTYKVPKTSSQMERVDGAPVGTRGGISVIHTFPADGEYTFILEFHPGPTGFLYGMTSLDEQLEVSINGERVALIDIDPFMSESDPDGMKLETGTIHVKAGPQRVTAAFIKKADGPVNDLLRPVDYTLADTQIGSSYGVTTAPHLRDLGIGGPFHVSGVSETPSRAKIFTCRPTARDEERPCAEEILTRLATRAYRRPATDDDIADLMAFYDMGVEEAGFEAGVRTALQAILASPHFVFRLEEMPASAQPGDVYRISAPDLASRLSFFLWGSPPDDALIETTRDGSLLEPDVLQAQTIRMLEDPRAEAFGTRFASQWFRLQDLEKIHPDALQYGYWDHRLSEAMERETELFFYNLVKEDRPLFELLDADYTFVNERLARHYGIPGVSGTHFQRVRLEGEARRGILGHGSILTLTSHADRTSPVLRGKWVMEVLLGSPPPPPPPNVPDLEATQEAEEGRMLTVRERMEMHRALPMCRSCHRVIDPIGLALENFDVTGAWRIKDEGMPVDPTGELYDGAEINGPASLRAALLSRPEVFRRVFIENLMAYALGRRIETYDMPTVRAISKQAAADGDRMSSYILGVVNSPAFQMSRAEAVTEDEDMQGAGS